MIFQRVDEVSLEPSTENKVIDLGTSVTGRQKTQRGCGKTKQGLPRRTNNNDRKAPASGTSDSEQGTARLDAQTSLLTMHAV